MAIAGILQTLGAGISSTAQTAMNMKELERRAEADAARLKLSMETLELNKKRLTLLQEQQQQSRMMEALDIQNDAVMRQRDMEDRKEMLRFGTELEKELIRLRGTTPAKKTTKVTDPNLTLSRLQAQKDEVTQQLQRMMELKRKEAYGKYVEETGDVAGEGIFKKIDPMESKYGWFGGEKSINPAYTAQQSYKWWKRGMASEEVRDSANVLLGGIPGFEKHFGKKKKIGPKGFDATKLSDLELRQMINE